MLSRVSWSLLIAAGMVGSGAGIALTADQAAGRAGPMSVPDTNVMAPSPDADEFIRAQVRAHAASREPFAIFRAATRR